MPLALARSLESVYGPLGYQVGKWPWLFLAVGWAVYLAAAWGIYYGEGDTKIGFFNMNTDFLDQWSDRDTRYWRDFEFAASRYPEDRDNVLLYTVVSGSVCTVESLKEGRDAELELQEGLVGKDDDGNAYTFNDVCARRVANSTSLSDCEVWSLFRLLLDPDGPSPATMEPLASMTPAGACARLVANVPSERRRELRLLVGEGSTAWPGASASEAQLGAWLADAKAVQTFFKFRASSAGSRPLEEEIADWVVRRAPNWPGTLRVSGMLSASVGLECSRLAISVLPLFGITMLAMIIYIVAFLSTETRVPGNTQYLLILASLLIPAGASAASFGLLGFLGRDLTVLSPMTPFLTLAVGVDSVFLLLSAMKTVAPGSDDVPEIISRACAIAGSAVTLSSTTSTVAFGVGAVTSWDLPGLATFCLGLVFSLVMSCMGMVVILPAMLALNERRMQANRCDLMPCFKRCRPLHTHDEATFTLGRCESKVSAAGRRIVEKHTTLLESNWCFNIVGALLMLGMVVSGCLLAPSIGTGMEDSGFVADSSYVIDFFDDVKASLDGRVLVEMKLLLEHPQLASADYLDGLNTLLTSIESRDDVVDVVCWCREFAATLENTTAWQALERASSFLESSSGISHAPDAQWSANGGLESVRCHVFAWQPVDKDSRQLQGHDLVDMVDGATVPAILYHVSLPVTVGRKEEVKSYVFIALGGAAGAVAVVVALFLPVHFAVFALLNCGSVVVVLLGMMSLLNFDYDYITCSVAVLTVGFTIDYSCHVCHFASSAPKGATIAQRMVYGVATCGYDVMHGCVTALIGVVLLYFGQSSAYRTFSVLSLLVIGVGGVFALYTMPSVVIIASMCCSFGPPQGPRQADIDAAEE